MNEEQLRERLQSAADLHHDHFAVADDVDRGRRGLARRRRAVVGGSLATVAVLTAVTLTTSHWIGASPDSSGDDAGIVSQPSAGPSDMNSEPEGVTQTFPPVEDGLETLPPEGTGTEDGLSSIDSTATQPWRDDLYALAISHLDPNQQHLNYDTDSEQGGGDSDGNISLGIKLGWKSQDEDGEGMIQIAVATSGTDGLLDPCNVYGPCRETTRPGHAPFKLSGDPNSSAGYAIQLRQIDGEQVQIVVDPLFGNNASQPTMAALPSLDRVLDLAADADLNLP